MRVEYDNIWEQYKKLTIKKLIKRGLEETEAVSIMEIFSNLIDKRKPVYQLEILNEVLKEGDYRMGCTGQMAGAHYGELKKMVDKLQDAISEQGITHGKTQRY